MVALLGLGMGDRTGVRKEAGALALAGAAIAIAPQMGQFVVRSDSCTICSDGVTLFKLEESLFIACFLRSGDGV